MAVKTTAVPSAIPDPGDSSGLEDDVIQKKMNDFAFRYYDTVLKIEKAKKSAVERGLGQSHSSFVIKNESTGTGGQDPDIGAVVGTDLRRKVADNIKHIVTPDAQNQLDYSLYKAKVDALYSQFPDLGISDKIWVLFQLGAQFLVSSVEDKDVLVKFPGQAAHEIGLDKHPKEMDEVLKMDLGTSV
jgi:hypothetical protein